MKLLPSLLVLALPLTAFAAEPVQVSGIYPHLAMFNNEGECGTGAVVPWADRLWVITYGPHLPWGSSDKLYEITPGLEQIIRPESVGGTPANRMIHRESQQLFIGPYVIDAKGGVRVIPPKLMPGRLTGNARHLTDPAGKIHYATMEEGLYEVDVKTLAVTGLIRDGNKSKPGQTAEVSPATVDSKLPGYHGKGLYSGQGRVIYANNGDHDPRVITDPTTPSGALGEWRKPGDDWQLVRRNQFTEVTGPGGIYGSEKPDTDPIWSIGWDAKSLILMLLDFPAAPAEPEQPGEIPNGIPAPGKPGFVFGPPGKGYIDVRGLPAGTEVKNPFTGKSFRVPAEEAWTAFPGGEWTAFRLPKASHSYDGAHGWNTEWPRIRDIGEPDLLMTMHGTFWKFPRTFSARNTAGIAPRSTYLKVIGDFCRWNDRVVLGCDDTAKSEFLNKRKVKGELVGAGQSQSNLWFIKPEQLDQFGPVTGHGAVWMDDDVKAGAPSDPFLFAGYPRRSLHLAHETAEPVTFTVETDGGDGVWKELRKVTLPAGDYQWIEFAPQEKGAWVRLTADRDAANVTADFHLSAPDERAREAAPIFAGLAVEGAKNYSGGLVRARGEDLGTLSFAAATVRDGRVESEGYYELDAALNLRRVNDEKTHAFTKEKVAVPKGVISSDAASVLVVDDRGRRWRIPKGDTAFDREGALPLRVDREVCTERDLFQTHGTFFELPAENADGFAKMRPVTTHNRRITDYCTWRGLFVMAGVEIGSGAGAPPAGTVGQAPRLSGAGEAPAPLTAGGAPAPLPADNRHIVRSDDGQCALWLGGVDDLWQFGKPVGTGGPWKDAAVRADEPSDAYLMHGYEKKSLALSHDAASAVKFTVEVDFLGTGLWREYQTFAVEPGQPLAHTFPTGYTARWVRLKASQPCRATATFRYE
jgi:hypothetical protein